MRDDIHDVVTSPSLLRLRFHVRNHLIGGIERAVGAASFYVSQAFGEPGVDGAALLRGVLIAGTRRFGNDRDDSAGGPEFELLAAFKTGASQRGRRNDNRRFVFDFNGHRDCHKLSSSR